MSSDKTDGRGDEPRDEAETPASGETDAPVEPTGEVESEGSVEPEGPAEPEGTVAREDSAESEGSEPPQDSKSDEVAKSPDYYDDPYEDHDDYDYGNSPGDKPVDDEPTKALATIGSGKTPPSKPPPADPVPDDDDEDGDEDGMVRMSFLGHLEELRTRIIRALIGVVIVYLICLTFHVPLFKFVIEPFNAATAELPYDPPLQLTQITPMEQFHMMYIKIPILAGIFLGSPWLMFQVWAFIAPGLYKRERKWAAPFIGSTAGLFVLGGVFCYTIALRFAIQFLVGLGDSVDVRPMITVTSYYDMFFNLHVGLGVVFQMPVVIFFFTLLRITSPGFLLANTRYAILIIFIIAAVITPTPDVLTMMTFAAPMILLFFVGIAASYTIVWKREGRGFPWKGFMLTLLILLAIAAGVVAVMHYQFGYVLTPNYPWIAPPG